MRKKEEREKTMMMDMKCPGRMAMSGKVKLGVPRNKVSSKNGSISAGDTRGQGEAKVKKG